MSERNALTVCLFSYRSFVGDSVYLQSVFAILTALLNPSLTNIKQYCLFSYSACRAYPKRWQAVVHYTLAHCIPWAGTVHFPGVPRLTYVHDLLTVLLPSIVIE